MGLDEGHAGSTLRFSFCRYNTMEEVERAVEGVVAGVEKMRMLMGVVVGG
jgi:cysteine sulfinate desulfinase/cysteine desulfurase-like protein